MTTAWTRGIAVALLAWPLGCEVTVTDDLEGVGGVAASSPTAGRGGSAGTAGSGGRGGSGGVSGSSGSGGQGGSAAFPTPTCTAEPEDVGDECVQCLKRSCCTQWLACDDQTCADEWQDTSACVLGYNFPGPEEYGMCVSESASEDMLPQPNTNDLLTCINVVVPSDGGLDTTQCGVECFGIDILFD
jgi:hypothetical protein